jgi:hypothetical protein
MKFEVHDGARRWVVGDHIWFDPAPRRNPSFLWYLLEIPGSRNALETGGTEKEPRGQVGTRTKGPTTLKDRDFYGD